MFCIVISNLQPFSYDSSSAIEQFIKLPILRQIGRLSPMPECWFSALKNLSNTILRSSFFIPHPVSVIDITALPLFMVQLTCMLPSAVNLSALSRVYLIIL